MIWPFIHKTNPRRQIDPIECGAVALGMVLEYFGRFVTNAELREAAQVSRSGSNASSIIEASKKYGMQATAKKMLASEVNNALSPSILFVDLCHFVVFEGLFFGRYYLNDPARGRYSLDKSEFRKRFSKIIITFTKSPAFVPDAKPSRFLPADLRAMFIMSALGFFSGITFATTAAMAGFFLSKSLPFSVPMSTVLLVLFLWSLVSSWTLIKTIMRTASRACSQEISLLERVLLKIPFGFFQEIPFFVFAHAYKNAAERNLSFTLHHAKGYFFIPFVVVLVVSLAIISPLVALIGLGALFIYFLQQVAQKISAASPHAHASLSTVYDDPRFDKAMSQANDMRAMGQEALLINGLLSRMLSGVRLDEHKKFSAFVLLSPALPVFLFVVQLCLVAAELLPRGDLSWAELFSVIIISFGVIYAAGRCSLQPVGDDVRENNVFKRELDFVLGQVSTKIEQAHNGSLIEFRDASFNYRGHENAIVVGLNLRIQRGDVIGVVGPPLCGKSTLLSLIGNKIVPTNGAVSHFVSEAPFLRVGVIDDDTDVFDGTLQENLTLFERMVSETELVRALEKACATDLFYNRPMGLLAPIVNHGTNLSTGEKKRLLLAQALVHNPDILVLDNFFETLDEKTARTILRNLRAENRTVVLTSYRSNELAFCTQVLLLEQAEKRTLSTHETLLKNALYQTLVGALPVSEELL